MEFRACQLHVTFLELYTYDKGRYHIKHLGSERRLQMFLGKPEVFWVGIQAICAVLGVIGLTVYTFYARQQAAYTQATLRASLTPYIAVASQHPEAVQKGSLKLEAYKVSYRNVGQGAALRLRSWHRYADKRILTAFETREMTLLH